MKWQELMKCIVGGERLADKLVDPREIEWDEKASPYEIPSMPARSRKLAFSDKQIKFPKSKSLSLDDKKAQALNSFANHELLAIEMMASAILKYPHSTPEELRFKKGVLASLIDEQKHFKLYQERMNELGYEFGDFPLNDFFWKQMKNLKTPAEYLAVMSLTFEAANLDFAIYYEGIFRSFDDHKTGDIMKVVYEDEISHVKLGTHFLTKWREDKSLWDYYLTLLPFPMSPARSKGIIFDRESRVRAKFDQNFIENLEVYKDNFEVVERKTWK